MKTKTKMKYVFLVPMDDFTGTMIVEVTDEEFEVLKEYEDDLAQGNHVPEISAMKLYSRPQAIPPNNRIVVACC